MRDNWDKSLEARGIAATWNSRGDITQPTPLLGSKKFCYPLICYLILEIWLCSKYKIQSNLAKERFDKEQIGIKEPFPVTNLPFTS